MIEGSTYLLKQTALTAAITSRIPLTPAEYALMAEETFDLDTSGKPRSAPKFLRLADNLKFTVECVNRVFRTELKLDVAGSSWSDFKTAVEIRNRITHPKSAADFEVSEAEVSCCRRMSEELFYELISSMVTAISEKIAPRGSPGGKHEPDTP